MSDNEIRENIQDFLKDAAIRGKFNKDYIEKAFHRKMEKYLSYICNSVNTGTIKSNIHVISKEGGNKEKLFKWSKLTSNFIEIYEGFGMHDDMLNDHNVEKNAQIVKQILEKINS